jgi:hypothetical protein
MLKVKVNNEEIIKAKFSKTIANIEGYLTEARGDVAHGTQYSANAVYRRMQAIQEAFYRDVAQFAKDIKVGSGPKSSE